MTNEVETFTAYLNQIPRESPLADLCREVVDGETLPMTDSIHLGLEQGIALIAACPLLLWACLEFDALRNRRETQEAERRIAMILNLQKEGYSRERAERLVEKTLNAIRKRNKEDPAIKSLLQIARVTKDLQPPSHLVELIQSDDATPEQKEP